MSNEEKVLDIAECILLPMDTDVYLLDDGTLLYWNSSSSARLYVKLGEEEIDADLPTDEAFDYSCYGAHGNAVYLCNGFQVHQAVFTPPCDLDVSQARYILEHEKAHFGVVCSCVKDGKTHVYRLFDVPDDSQIVIDTPEEELEKLQLQAIHRGKAIYSCWAEEGEPQSVRQMGSNAIVIEVTSNMVSIHARDSSSFIYFSVESDSDIHVLDSSTMKFLPSFRVSNITSPTIVGVHKGEITITGPKDDDYEELFIVKTKLPDEYFDKTSVEEESKEAKIYEEPPKKKRKHTQVLHYEI